MRIHIFNPEHETALAANKGHFTAPHAARKLRHDLAYLPAVYGQTDDVVVVEDVDAAQEAMQRLALKSGVRLMSRQYFERYMRILASEMPLEVIPWGWDMSVHSWLESVGVNRQWLPSKQRLDFIRTASNRQWAATHILEHLCRINGTVGKAEPASNLEDVFRFISVYGDTVLKAPWSSSGRGLRYIRREGYRDWDAAVSDHLRGWIRNVVAKQGFVMMEPIYDKVADYALEFQMNDAGKATYCGLSVFHTANGAYAGNIVATEEEKWASLSRYIDVEIIRNMIPSYISLLDEHIGSNYAGPLGIDAMIVRKPVDMASEAGQNLLYDSYVHPCVELNLRNTMGHLALSMGQRVKVPHVMRIDLEDKYRLRLMPIPSAVG